MIEEESCEISQDTSTKIFQTIRSGDLKTLKEYLKPSYVDLVDANDNEKATSSNQSALLSIRAEADLVVRRPSNSNEARLHNPSLLHTAISTWYPDIVEYICSLGLPMDLECDVDDITNKPPSYKGLTPLHMAAMLGKLKMVQTLVKHGAEIDHMTSLGDSALFEACFEGHLAVVEYLVENGADTNLSNNRKTNCLMIACFADNVEVVQLLVEKGVDLDATDKDNRNVLFYASAGSSADTLAFLFDAGAKFLPDKFGVTTLMEAVFHKKLDIVKYLLEAFIKPPVKVHAKDSYGRNALFYAAEHDSIDLMKYLFDFGLQCTPAEDGRTLLMVCALNGNITLIKFLMEYSVTYSIDINAVDTRGRNCLFYSVTGSNEDVFEYFIQKGVTLQPTNDGITVLMQAIAKNKYRLVEHFLTNKDSYTIDINAVDNDGWCPMLYSIAAAQSDLFALLESYGALCPPAADGRTMIMQAAATGDLNLLRFILDKARRYGILINQRDKDGWTALFYTIQGCHLDAFKLLIKRGARVIPALNGSTVLMEASDKGKGDMVEYLVKMAATLDLDINYKDKYGANVLFYCVAGGHINLLKFLLNAGCHVDVDTQSRTLLMQAAMCGHAQMIQYLVMYAKTLHIDLNALDKEGRNVLHYCVEGGHLDLLEFLIGCGVRSVVDNSNVTLLMTAAKKGHAAITRYLLQHRMELDIDIDAQDNNGENAMFYAIGSANIQVCRMLLDQDIKLASNKVGINPLPQCMAKGKDKIVNAILLSAADLSEAAMGKDDSGKCTFYHCVEKSDLNTIRRLKEFYQPLLDSDVDGCSVLMRACHTKSLDLVRCLVEEVKCDIYKRDNLGRSALFHAAEKFNIPALTYLLERVDHLDCDTYGNSILMCTITTGDHSVFDVLIASRFFRQLLEQRNHLLQNPSHVCAIVGRDAFLHSLHKLGCDLDLQDKYGATPLMYACANSHVGIASFLLRSCAAVDSQDLKKQTALHYCFYENPSLNSVKLLLSYGADINEKDNSGKTPLLLACQTCAETHIHIISYMLREGANPCIIDDDGKDAFDHCPFESSYVKALMKKFAEIDSREAETIKQYTEELKELSDVAGLLRGLIQNKVITRTLHFEIAKRPQIERVPALLEILLFRGPKALRLLCKALKESGEQELAFCMMKSAYQKEREILV